MAGSFGPGTYTEYLNRIAGDYTATVVTLKRTAAFDAAKRGLGGPVHGETFRQAVQRIDAVVIQAFLNCCQKAADRELRRLKLPGVQPSERWNPFGPEIERALSESVSRLVTGLPQRIIGNGGGAHLRNALAKQAETHAAIFRVNKIGPAFDERRTEFDLAVAEIRAKEDIHQRSDFATAQLLRNPRQTVNTRMQTTLKRKPESRDWSARQWADHLGCAKSTVHDTSTWKALMIARAGAGIDRLVRDSKSTVRERRRANRRRD